MFQYLTGLDQGLDQVKDTTFFRALSPNGCFVLQAASPGQHRMLSEQEVLALQLQEQAARQQALVHTQQQQLGQQQQPPLQTPQQVQQQVPQKGFDQMRNKRFIRALSPNGSFVLQGASQQVPQPKQGPRRMTRFDPIVKALE